MPTTEKGSESTQLALKKKVDLRGRISSPIIDQGLLNSCSACAISIAFSYHLNARHQASFQDNSLGEITHSLNASQMFVYYNERVMEGKFHLNAPVKIRDGFKSLMQNGVCSEELWPYPRISLPPGIKALIEKGETEELLARISQALKEHEAELQAVISRTPSSQAIAHAQQHKITRYCSLSIEHGVDELKLALSMGIPFVFGIMEPESFFVIGKDGQMPMPDNDELRLGGHALIAVGYDDEKKVFIVRNSYGTEFGDNGHCYMPYDFIIGSYIQNNKKQANAFSFWCLSTG